MAHNGNGIHGGSLSGLPISHEAARKLRTDAGLSGVAFGRMVGASLAVSTADVNVLYPESLPFIGEYLKSKQWPFVILDESVPYVHATWPTRHAAQTELASLLRGFPVRSDNPARQGIERI